MSDKKIIFMGTPLIAANYLNSLINNKYNKIINKQDFINFKAKKISCTFNDPFFTDLKNPIYVSLTKHITEDTI